MNASRSSVAVTLNERRCALRLSVVARAVRIVDLSPLPKAPAGRIRSGGVGPGYADDERFDLGANAYIVESRFGQGNLVDVIRRLL